MPVRSISSGSTSSRNTRSSVARNSSPAARSSASCIGKGWTASQRRSPANTEATKARQLPFLLCERPRPSPSPCPDLCHSLTHDTLSATQLAAAGDRCPCVRKAGRNETSALIRFVQASVTPCVGRQCQRSLGATERRPLSAGAEQLSRRSASDVLDESEGRGQLGRGKGEYLSSLLNEARVGGRPDGNGGSTQTASGP